MQHRRLRAVALIWKGLTFGHPYFGDVAEAAACRDQARVALGNHTRDYIWAELQLLEQLLARSAQTRGSEASTCAPARAAAAAIEKGSTS